jgi:thiosulfate/3-mercaptopyruvate sulfurtransferase
MTTPISDRGYARPDLLAETGWLQDRLGDRDLCVVDARSEEDYASGHIPGAVSVPGFTLAGIRSGPDMPASDAFASLAGSLGIDNDTTVVVYDETGPMAGMTAWVFLYYGQAHTRLLDGGLPKWKAEGNAVTTDVSSREPRTFTPELMDGIYCRLDQAKNSLGQNGVVFWDTRSLDEYTGATAPFNPPPRLGHLPGAVHLEWSELFEKEPHTLKPAAELKSLLTSKGITPESAVTTY